MLPGRVLLVGSEGYASRDCRHLTERLPDALLEGYVLDIQWQVEPNESTLLCLVRSCKPIGNLGETAVAVGENTLRL
jgi:hypothetical protein